MEKKELKYLIVNVEKDVENIEEKVEIIYEKYYEKSYFRPYMNSRNKLAQMIIEGEFPTVKEWNKIAYQDGFLSSTTMKYMEDCSWNQLEQRIRKEIKKILKGN